MSLDFLATLEQRVRDAADRLESLVVENAALRREVERLERAARDGAKPDRSLEKLEKAWGKERDEIRKRTEALVERLESLLAEVDPSV